MTIEFSQSYVLTEGHEVEEVPDGYVVYQPARDRVHFLNPTAVIVYELCDGAHDLNSILTFLAGAFDLPAEPVEEVRTCIARFVEEGLVIPSNPSSSAA